jgi:hypothetical protein
MLADCRLSRDVCQVFGGGERNFSPRAVSFTHHHHRLSVCLDYFHDIADIAVNAEQIFFNTSMLTFL